VLERKDVAHMTKLWQKTPDPNIVEEAQNLANQFTKKKSLACLCAAMSGIALYTGYEEYCKMSSALFDMAIQKDIPIELLMPWHVPENGFRKYMMNVKESGIVCSGLKKQGLKVGFVHGHYRLLTPANWVNVLLATEKCDALLVGMEDGWRTKTYKKAGLVVKDWQRHQWFFASGIGAELVRISRSDYSNRGYRNILMHIKPDMYFGNLSISPENQQEMIERAKTCGAVYISLPKQAGLSTSDIVAKHIH
jgi:hypothetical protein